MKLVVKRRSRGQASIELAVCLPLFLLILLLTWEMGNAFDVKQKVRAAAYEGARLACKLNTLNMAGIESVAKTIAGDLAEVTASDSGWPGTSGGHIIQVTVTVNKPLITGSFLTTRYAEFLYSSGSITVSANEALPCVW